MQQSCGHIPPLMTDDAQTTDTLFTDLEILSSKAELVCQRQWPAKVERLPADRGRMAAGTVFGGIQIGVILSGEGGKAPGGEIALGQGDAFVIEAGTGPELRRSFGVEMFVIQSAGASLLRFLYFDGSAGGPVAGITVAATPFANQCPTYWQSALELAGRLGHLGQGDRGSDTAVAQAVMDAAVPFLKSYHQALLPPVTSDARARVACATLYLSARLCEASLRKADIGKHLGVSESLLTLLFRKCGSIGLREHMVLQRLERARIMLAETSATVYEIASAIGVTYQHFIRTFRSRYGFSPLRFRKAIRVHAANGGGQASALFATEGFELLESGATPALTSGDNKPTLVLTSNTTQAALRVMRTGPGGERQQVGLMAPCHRSLLFETPGTEWSVENLDGAPLGTYTLPVQNSHLLVA